MTPKDETAAVAQKILSGALTEDHRRQLEARLMGVRDLPAAEELLAALAAFAPGAAEDGLLDEEALKAVARDVLHDLDDHTYCVHGMPLKDRPERR